MYQPQDYILREREEGREGGIEEGREGRKKFQNRDKIFLHTVRLSGTEKVLWECL